MFSIRRSIYVFFKLFPFLISFLRDFQRFVFFGPPRRLTAKEHAERAKQITDTVAHLGPTFIKAIQVLGMREDLLPKTYTDQFKTLQDKVPPFPTDVAMQILEEELGGPVADMFDSLDPAPIAAASLGQVHRAVYRGKTVAVKILRPNVERIVSADLSTVVFLVRLSGLFIDSFVIKNLWTVLHEFRRMVFVEMDFRNEARHAARLRSNLRKFERVVVPECLVSLTTRRVSVFEFHEGVRVDDVERLRAQGVAPSDLVARLIEVYVHQTVIDGFVHADPHPGNLLIDSSGRLVVLDFGMAVELDPEVRTELLRLVVAVVRNDVDTIVEGFYRLRMVQPQINTAVLRDAARTLMGISLGTTFSPRRIQEICEDIYSTFHRFPIRLPESLVYLLRASALIEGIGISFDPHFNGVRVARPIVKRIVAGQVKELERPMWEETLRRMRRLVTFWEELSRLVYRAERDQLHVRIHPADLTSLERCYQAMVRRFLLGLGALGLGLLGGFVYARTGSVWWLGGCGVAAFILLAGALVIPLRRKVVLRDEPRP